MPTLCLTLAAVALVAAALCDLAQARDDSRPLAIEAAEPLANDAVYAKGPCRSRSGGGKGGVRPYPCGAPASSERSERIG